MYRSALKMQAEEVLDLVSLSLIRFSFMFKHLLDALQWIHVWPCG